MGKFMSTAAAWGRPESTGYFVRGHDKARRGGFRKD